ncbi:Ca2+/calmodulin-dependent protein kinase [Ostreococcus tauri]|uniref:Ca2+/calmodulin-dependent protein kinase n=1 Tax=Ostreococcus tauri TaxID=70448 RepID=A0A1Y5I5C1_OSTTA|nr:Ca2+/calmodulin-dependent protein kinase [Ostreococcus tauri]
MHLARAARQHGGAVLAAVAAALFCACERVERRFGYDSQNVCLFATLLALVGLLLSETRPDRRAEKLTTARGDADDLPGMRLVDFTSEIADAYDVGRKIGVGQQGAVYACVERSTGRRLVMKETHIGVFGASQRRVEAYREIELLSKMNHPSVVKIVKAYQTPTDVQVVMEDAGDRTLIGYLVKLDESALTESERGREKHEMLRQIVDAVAHVHARSVVFRDLKHDNLVVRCDEDCRNARVTLVDFGRAASLKREERLRNLPPLGTSLFQAPEVEERREYGQAADMWAVGVFTYFLVTGKMPFEHSAAGLYKVLRGEYEPLDASVDRQAKDLISKLLVRDPSKRMNAAQAITHKFLRQGNSAHMHVSLGDSLRVPAHMETAAKKQLRALVMQESLERHTVGLLAEMLTPDDVTTLQRWLSMKAERSVHHGRNNVHKPNHMLDTFGSEAGSREGTTHSGKAYQDEVEGRKALNSLYTQMKREQAIVGESTDVSFHGGMNRSESFAILTEAAKALLEVDSTKDLTDALEHSPSPDKKGSSRLSLGQSPGAAQNSSSKLDPISRQISLAPRSLVGFAHSNGLCTVDELITACYSAGLPRVAEELQTVRDTLKSERVAKLKSLGADEEVQNESVLLDIMLFRYEDLFTKIESAHLQALREMSEQRTVTVKDLANISEDLSGHGRRVRGGVPVM